MNKNKKKIKKRYIFLGIFLVLFIIVRVFMYFGGFSTGKNIDPQEFLKYSQDIENINIPENVKIIALGEATHGNVEFQELKLEIFKIMVEKYGVKAFAIEGDYGGCEKVNQYILGGDGSADEIAKAIDFQIYKTKEIAELISYMRKYNEKVTDSEKLRFYGFDMQRYKYNFEFLNSNCKKLGIETKELEKLMNGNEWNNEYDNKKRIEVITQIKKELQKKENSEQAIHLADILLQYFELKTIETNDISLLRDKYMAENVKWILKQEEQLGHNRIFISGHNMHVAKYGSMDSMGKLLFKELENKYYVIGTDFYKTKVNLPKHSSNNRTIQTFYSHDPLAKTAKLAGLDRCWLDFSNIPKNTELYNTITSYIYMGNLGENYSLIMRLLPPSYRTFQPPATLYDSMIIVVNATPTKIVLK